MSAVPWFSTHHLPPDQRVARWTEAASDRFVELGFHVQVAERFMASMQHRDLETLSVTRIVSAGHDRKHITRSTRQAARAAESFFLASVQLEGRCWIAQDGRETLLLPGQFAVYDTRRAYELLLEGDYAQAVLRVPVRTLAAGLPGSEALTASAVAAEAAPARRLRQAVLADWGEGTRHTPRGAGLAETLLRSMRGGLRTLQDGGAPQAPRSRTEQLARIQAHVLAHLGDPGLGVASIAASLGVSTSYLHQVFRAEGCTLERWIWARRLSACEAALRREAGTHRSITAIAHEHGFSDAAHFSRSFAKRYGRSPREHRQAAAALLQNR